MTAAAAHAAIRAMRAKGIDPSDILDVVDAILAADNGDPVAERRRAYDRERKAKAAPERISTGIPPEKGSPERPSEFNSKPTEFNQNPSKNPPTGVKKVPGETRLLAAGVSESLIADWKRVRLAKKAGPITETVADGLIREAGLAGISQADAVRTAVERGWQGFRANWLKELPSTGPPRRSGGGIEALDRFIEHERQIENETFGSDQTAFPRLAASGGNFEPGSVGAVPTGDFGIG